MVNFGLNFASILGIFLAVAGAALYFMRSVRPELSRDHDIFFAAVGLLCGFILVFQGWRLDPILQFGQMLLSAATVFFAVESIRLRGVATEQAKRNTRIVDEDRPVSQAYSTVAELDDLEPIEEERITRRIQPSRDVRRSRTDDYYEDDTPRRRRRDEYEDEGTRRRSSSRVSSADRLGQGDKARRRSTRQGSRTEERPSEDEWGSPTRSEDWDVSSSSGVSKSRDDWDATSTSRSGNGSSRSGNRNPDVASRPRKRRPSQDLNSRRERDVEATPTDYVDYKPVDRSDSESDNSANFDEL